MHFICLRLRAEREHPQKIASNVLLNRVARRTAFESRFFRAPDYQNGLRDIPGTSWERSLADSGTLLGALGALLGCSWGALGRSWALLGRSWAALGPLLAALGRSWAPLGRSWGAKIVPRMSFFRKMRCSRNMCKTNEKH